jgi:predicted DNA-binding protein
MIMQVLQIKLNEQNSRRADALARETGKTPQEVVNEVFEHVAEESEADEHEKFLAWREAAMRVVGIWKDRDDLPDFDEIRRSMDRNVWGRTNS